jgi:hypothetical protein
LTPPREGATSVLQVVGFVDDERVQYGMLAAMSGDPKTR